MRNSNVAQNKLEFPVQIGTNGAPFVRGRNTALTRESWKLLYEKRLSKTYWYCDELREPVLWGAICTGLHCCSA